MNSIFLMLACIILGGQSDDKLLITDRCDLILSSMRSKPAEMVMYVCSSSSDTIVIYDSAGFCSNCEDDIICNKTIMISHIGPARLKAPNVVELYNYYEDEKMLTLNFWRPYSGNAVKLKYKIRKCGRYRLIGWEGGAF